VIQKDGKIVAAGYSDAEADDPSYDFALARYRTTGALDPSFGAGGTVLTDLGSESFDQAFAVAIQENGKIVAAGLSDADDDASDFALARYTKTGALDRSFGRRGRVLTDFGSGSFDYAQAVAIQKDGKIVAAGARDAAGSSVDDFALARYRRTGALDRSFGTAGTVLTDLGSDSFDQALAVAIQQDGKIVAAGGSDAGGSRDFALARYEK
jgi:uncharacterized delta-60 repeat protein